MFNLIAKEGAGDYPNVTLMLPECYQPYKLST